MAASAPIALILGAGANIGQNVARVFAERGHKVALVSRSIKEEDSTPSQLNVRGDLSKPESVTAIFAKVKAQLGTPHVVVYNAAAATFGDPKNPLALPLDDLSRSLAINTLSVYAAVQQAVLGFEELPASSSRTFIYTGNILNMSPSPALLDLGVGKSATAHIINVSAEGYKEKGFKFYYADERTPDGGPASRGIDGPAHAEFYAELAKQTSQGPWLQTFVKGVGYQKF